MKTVLRQIFDNFKKKYDFTDAEIALFENALKLEKNQMIDFGHKMQMIKDVDFDGNVIFYFSPEGAFLQMYEKE
jgi:hypothetical protein